MSEIGYRSKCLREKGEVCVNCGNDEKIHVHHKDADQGNNELENLIPLCASCHMKVHQSASVDGLLKELQDQVPQESKMVVEGGADPWPIGVSKEQWKELNSRKEPGESFSEVVGRLLEENE